jgi:hypothetical protein
LYEHFINPDSFAKLADIPISNVVAISGGWVDFIQEEGIKEASIVDRQIGFACAANLPLRLFICNPKDEVSYSLDALHLAVWNLSEVVMRWISYCDLNICIENHGRITNNPEVIDVLIDNVRNNTKCKTVGITLDPGNFMRAGVDPLKAIHIINPKFIQHVHIKDVDKDGKWCVPGDGLIGNQLKKIIQYLKDIEYCGVVTYEYEGNDLENRTEHIVRGYNWLMEQINE